MTVGRSLILAALLLPGAALAGSYATCLLDKLPGLHNDVAAHAVVQSCSADHPGGFDAIKQGAGRGWLSYKSGADCTMKKAGETRSNRAAVLIGSACRKLYDSPVTFSFEEAARKD